MLKGPFIEDHIGAPFSIVAFENYSYIFSIEAELDASAVSMTDQLSNSGEIDDEKCALLFIGDNSNIVLLSNTIRYCIVHCDYMISNVGICVCMIDSMF